MVMHPQTKYHWPILKGKEIWPRQHSPIILPLFDLGVKGQGRMNVMIVHSTSSNCHAPTHQISLTYLERQKGYGQYKFLLLFDLEVKGQGQMNVKMIHDTSSNGHASAYQISLTFLKIQRSYGLDKFYQLFDLGVKGQGQMNVMMVCDTLSNDHAPTH